MNKIPSVDLADFLSEDPNRKQKFVNEIGTAYENIGFVSLRSHFLDDALVSDLYKEVKAFFALDLAKKKQYEIEGLSGQRGYVSFGKEHAKGKKEGDLKEFWHFGQYEDAPKGSGDHYPDNIHVKELPHFNEIGKEVYIALEKTAQEVLKALALHIGLEEHYFEQYATAGNSILRPIHYPPITSEPKNAVRAAAHGDINLITLLMGAHGRGLQVKNHHGQWVDAIANEDELMINVGDMLSRLTNNQLKSTIHQVINPPKELWGTSRYSIPFFMHPRSEMDLTCLPSCVSEAYPKLYTNMTAGDFLNERLIELGLKKK
jgi:isopenicillin N synthase-like dioxygenase